MINTIHILNIVLPILYAATFAVYAYDFAQHKELLHNSKRAFLFVTLMVHIFYLLARTIEFNHPPITNKDEIFTILAFSIGFAYFLLELLTDIRGTGVFIILFSVIFQIFSSLFIQDLVEVKEILRNRLLGAHVISALLGYSGFTISAVHGLLFLILYKDIKLSKFGLIFNRLPSLETLEKLSFVSLVIGFVLLTISIIIGFSWLPSAFPEFSYFDPKLISAGLVWVIYGIGILVKLIANWYGKKVIMFSLVGFILALLSLFFSNIFASSFHTFY
jgi:ABC-type uncharacterized transport system permease subunit